MTARVTVVGLEGDEVPSADLLEGKRVVAGGRAQLARLPEGGPPQVVLGADIPRALNELLQHGFPALVLASGDPGFFGIVARLSDKFGRERLDVRPARSSISLAFARLGLSWDDAHVVSAHGRPLQAAINQALARPKSIVLTGPGDAAQVVQAIDDAGPGRQVFVLERLGYPDEQVIRAFEPAASYAEPNLVVVLDQISGAGKRTFAWGARTPTTWARPESFFEHRAGMITKAEVRAFALARLGPGTGDLVWDVGCGSGSVGIECAMLGARVIAVDHDQEAVNTTWENAQRHHVAMSVFCRSAPDELHDLPDPDAVFVGGGGDDLEAIVAQAAARTRRAVVVTLATVERVGPVLAALTDAGLEAEGTQLQASRIKPLGQGHRLDAQNPVFVLSGTRPA